MTDAGPVLSALGFENQTKDGGVYWEIKLGDDLWMGVDGPNPSSLYGWHREQPWSVCLFNEFDDLNWDSRSASILESKSFEELAPKIEAIVSALKS